MQVMINVAHIVTTTSEIQLVIQNNRSGLCSQNILKVKSWQNLKSIM